MDNFLILLHEVLLYGGPCVLVGDGVDQTDDLDGEGLYLTALIPVSLDIILMINLLLLLQLVVLLLHTFLPVHLDFFPLLPDHDAGSAVQPVPLLACFQMR